MKKKEGYIVSDFAIPLITILFVGVIIISFSIFTKESKRVNDLDSLGREYILRMESNGYLSSSDKESLIEELKSIGAKNISIQGTMSEVGYGNEIDLIISCNFDINTITVNGLSFKKGIKNISYSDKWSSTSKS